MVKSSVLFLLKNLANALHATNNLQIIPDFSLKDSRDQTVLGLALWTGKAMPEGFDACRQTDGRRLDEREREGGRCGGLELIIWL